MNRLDRLTAILLQLQSKRVVRAQEIADHFGISLRTVYRDVRSLETAGVPIVGEAGVGYCLVEGYRLPPVQFTPEEAAAFITAEKLVEGFTDAGLRRQFKSAMFKIKSVLRMREKDALETLEESVDVRPKAGKSAQNTPNGFLATILQGISDQELLSLQYQGRSGETPSYEYLARWMMQFADKVVAISPPELEQTFWKILSRAAQLVSKED